VDREEQLRWERDNARWAAGAAFASGLLTIAASLYLNSKLGPSPSDSVESIKLLHAHKSDLLVAALLTAIGTVLLAPPLYYLFRATRFRREQLPAAIRYLILLAPVLAAVSTVIRQIQLAQVSDTVATKLPLPPKAADDLIKHEVGTGGVVAVGGIATAAALGIAFMFILISLNAMRAGLLSRFMGVLGIIVGVLLVIPLQGNLPVVQVFWLAAIGMLILGLWPQGRGPAWDAGEAIPWPNAQDRRDAVSGGDRAPARPARTGWMARQREPEPHDDGDAPEPAEPQHAREPARPRPSSTHPRSKKRKRKRRG
jgi:hypothetical protein